ncbi:DUF3284 domain-containing protein [Ligilactobacillus acidipiscis]|uniref:DUF3284 domain-containing protein n=1 Tax=Ligilactobacillus acidipiscis TaxID=89059 RepID=A0A0R2KKZ2_9LACO|nr:DUF3284 domain-containing protein [Ligilactobacillus acidipiscis]KRN87133.1 hypothetical protein IV43_GL001937 [Ligilactobacillus acidipiscis]SFV41026.1 hypothetical protein LAC1533_1605 [Ligilactobacillus acidipiscis]
MKTSIKLNVSAQYIFERLVDSRIYDIFEATGRFMAADELAGFAYSSVNDEGESCQIQITKLISAASYHFQVETKDEIVSKAYDLKKLAADQVEVSYTQKVKAKNLLVALKNKTNSILFDWLLANNFKKILKQLEIGY